MLAWIHVKAMSYKVLFNFLNFLNSISDQRLRATGLLCSLAVSFCE